MLFWSTLTRLIYRLRLLAKYLICFHKYVTLLQQSTYIPTMMFCTTYAINSSLLRHLSNGFELQSTDYDLRSYLVRSHLYKKVYGVY